MPGTKDWATASEIKLVSKIPVVNNEINAKLLFETVIGFLVLITT
jgi:hypothetical protein